MAELKLNLGIGNLGEIARKLGSLRIGGSGSTSGGISLGGAAKIGVMVAGIQELVRKTQAIQTILDVISGFLNALITPFIPILIGLMKPFFILFQVVGMMLLKFLTKIGLGEKNKTGSTTGTAVGAVGGFAIAGTIGAMIGAVLGAVAGALQEMFMNWIINLGANLLTNAIMWIDKIFGTDFKKVFMLAGQGLSKVILGGWSLLKGIFTLNFNLIGQGFMQIFSGLWDILKAGFLYVWNFWIVAWNTFFGVFGGLFKSVWNGLKSIWDWLINALWKSITSFANLFIKGLNLIISLLNKIPGLNIGKVSEFKSGAAPTTINLNVAGDISSTSTMDNLAKALRGELNRRGAF